MNQLDLIMEYFKNNPNRDIEHAEVVDWVMAEWQKRAGKKFRDPDRGIRSLSEKGKLIKVGKGVYRYDPLLEHTVELYYFTEIQKKEILKIGNYKCAICGKGVSDGIELHVDHIKPKNLGGTNEIENGQVLCGQHNYIKKTFSQTETGKKMFINFYKLSKKDNNKKLEAFCNDILEVFEKHDINGHIDWDK